MKTDYEKLKEEFDDKVKELQSSCKHLKKTWILKGQELRPLNLTHEILVCKNCNKTLRKRKMQNDMFKPKGSGRVYFKDEIILLEKKKLKVKLLEMFSWIVIIIAGIMLILRVTGVIGGC